MELSSFGVVPRMGKLIHWSWVRVPARSFMTEHVQLRRYMLGIAMAHAGWTRRFTDQPQLPRQERDGEPERNRSRSAAMAPADRYRRWGSGSRARTRIASSPSGSRGRIVPGLGGPDCAR